MSAPIHILSLGAGVQSSTLALMAAGGEVGPMPQAAVFADTGDEPALVYEWLEWLTPRLPFPVVRAKNETSLSEHIFAAIESGGRVSNPPLFTRPEGAAEVEGILTRDCTRDFKVAVIQRAVRAVMREHDAKSVVQWIGISLDEIVRMKPSRVAYSTHRWPLIELHMSRHDCLRWMEKNGFPRPPRSACVYCPHHANSEWRRMKDEHEAILRDTPDAVGPTDWQRAVMFDAKIRTGIHKVRAKCFVHRDCVPLPEVDLSTDNERGQGVLAGFGNECEGLCGV